MTPEQKARKLIDDQLQQTGRAVQSADEMDITAARGVAVREFALEKSKRWLRHRHNNREQLCHLL